jgi:hypothetical protein
MRRTLSTRTLVFGRLTYVAGLGRGRAAKRLPAERLPADSRLIAGEGYAPEMSRRAIANTPMAVRMTDGTASDR